MLREEMLLEDQGRQERARNERSAEDSILKDCKLNSYYMTWQSFNIDKCNDTSSRVDLVETYPGEVSDDQKKSLTRFSMRTVKSASDVVMLVTLEHFREWEDTFSGETLREILFPCILTNMKDSLQRRCFVNFPPNHADLALVANTSGVHLNGFKSKFNDDIPSLQI